MPLIYTFISQNQFAMKKCCLILLTVISLSQPLFAQNKINRDSVLNIMTRVASWQLQDWKQNGMQHSKYDWTNGACYAGLLAFNNLTNDKKYINALYAIGDSLQWNTGPNRTMADDYCIGQMYSQLYMIYKQPTMIAKFKAQADSISSLPHIESLAWKNHIQNREWAWCDALFMGPPAFAYLSSATGDLKYLNTANKLWFKTTDYLFDKEENLYFRDSSFFTKREANGKKVFWSRGNGWVMGGLVRMLQNMPANYPDRSRYIDLYKKMAAKIITLQNADGSWHASLLDPDSYPVKETSGTSFYCYALAYGINKGLLPYDKYYPVVVKAWAALTTSVHPDGKLGYVQHIGAAPDKVTYDDTEVYGIGAFLLAGSEMLPLLSNHH